VRSFVLAAITALLILPPAASRAASNAAPSPCEAALEHATRVLAHSARGAVFWTRVGTYGCLFGSRRPPRLLARHTDAQSAQAAVLAGRFAAIRVVHGTRYSVNTDALVLFDLRSRRPGRELWPLGLPAHSGDSVQDFVVTARGALAWIGSANQFSERLGNVLPVEIHRLLGNRDRVLDRATRTRSNAPAEPTRLTLTPGQREVRWVRAGVVHSAPMR
jgi:hypothetical protein